MSKFGTVYAIATVLLFSLIFPSVSSAVSNVSFRGSLYLRGDVGDEVNTQSGQPFPDNLVERQYLESTFTGELLVNKVPLGKRLRIGWRVLELQASDYDIDYTNLEDARRWDDRIFAQLSGQGWEVWAGDVSETFGKGLTLNLFENRDLYHNTNLRGGKVNYRSAGLRVNAIYGKSRAWFNVKEENVGGVNVEVRAVKGVVTGVSLVHQEGLYYEKRLTPGVYTGFDIGPVSVYGEYAQRRLEDGDILAGDGTYLSVNASMLGLAAQLGYKYYNFGIENPFQTPPVVEREITTHLMSEHPHIPNINDQVGFEANVSASPTDILFLDLNFSQASKHKGNRLIPSLKQEDAGYWAVFLEGEVYARDDLTFLFGLGQNEEAYPTYWQKKTGLAGETTYSLSPLWSATALLENMWVNDRESDEQFTEQYLSLALNRASFGGMTFTYEQSGLDSRIEGDHWMGGELLLEVKRNHRLLLFYGRERGGLKCSSGVCRTVQSFEGFRLTYEGRF